MAIQAPTPVADLIEQKWMFGKKVWVAWSEKDGVYTHIGSFSTKKEAKQHTQDWNRVPR